MQRVEEPVIVHAGQCIDDVETVRDQAVDRGLANRSGLKLGCAGVAPGKLFHTMSYRSGNALPEKS
jgi:hypothetical protein